MFAIGRKQLYAALKYWRDELPLSGGKQLLNLAYSFIGREPDPRPQPWRPLAEMCFINDPY